VLLASCAALPAAASAQASAPTLTTTTRCLDPQSTADQYVDVTATGLVPGTAYYPQLELTEGAEEIAVGYPPGDLVADASGTGTSSVWFDAATYLANAPTAGDGRTVWVKLRLSSDWGVNAELSIPLCGVDTTAPVLALPADVAVDATSASGAAVSYIATATDDVDGTVAVSCDHASGSAFAVGTTAVACTATDAAGNAANGTFNVVVRPQPQTQPQQPDLRALLARLGLDANASNALREHLDRVLAANRQARCNALNALENEIRARTGAQRGKLLSPIQGDRALAGARLIGALLGCR
jgi:HYR domain